MARLSDSAERARRAAGRSCGSCSLCCTLLRVDELAKPAGVDCAQQLEGGGCGIHPDRPSICRDYHCLWLQGGLEDDERPDLIGGIVDLETAGDGIRLGIRELRRGVFDESPALRAIADRYRDSMPVRITDAENVMDPDRPFRVLLADGLEHRVTGELVEVLRDGECIERRRMPWAERWGRRLSIGWRRWRLARSAARGRLR